MGHIFVSYSRHDLELVDSIVRKFEHVGMRIWIDRDDIKAGRTWRAQIVQAIDTCDAFVLMLSSHSVVSENVRKEIDLAQDSGRTVFIMRLDPIMKLPDEMRYQLVGLQYVDLPTLGEEEGVKQLIDTLQEYLATLGPSKAEFTRETELVIQGVDPKVFNTEKQEQLIDFVAELTKTPDSQLQITKITTGSVHVFVKMPALTAFELKARALNRDHHFKRVGVNSLKLVGDRKYINISLGLLTTTATIGALKLLWMGIPSLFPSIVGVTAGKVLTIASALLVTTAMSVAISNAVPPVLSPTPTPTFTAVPTQTPTPQNPLVIRDTLCWTGPDPSYAVVSSIKANTRVEVVGRATIPAWWVIINPIYNSPCWMRESDLQINPLEFADLPIFTPSSPLMAKPHQPPNKGPTPTPCVPWWSCFYLDPSVLTAIAPTPP